MDLIINKYKFDSLPSSVAHDIKMITLKIITNFKPQDNVIIYCKIKHIVLGYLDIRINYLKVDWHY